MQRLLAWQSGDEDGLQSQRSGVQIQGGSRDRVRVRGSIGIGGSRVRVRGSIGIGGLIGKGG